MKIIKFEIETVLAALKGKKPGFYELSELLDGSWSIVLRERWYGIQFKKAVLAGKIKRVRWVGQKSNRHQLYELLAN
jgi:hypothetical protein